MTNIQPKRIFIFSTAYYPFVGGAEVAIKEITDRLPEHEWHLFTARTKRDLFRVEKIGNVVVHRVGLGLGAFDKWLLMKWGGWSAWWSAKKNKPDVAWSMMASWGGLAAWWFSVVNPKIPLVLTLQEGDEISTRKGGLVALGWRLILSRAKLVTVISNYLRIEAQKYGYKGEIILVPNGVDVKRFTERRVEVGLIRKEFEAKGAKKILIHTGRLTEKNALADVIRALPLLHEDVHFVSVGRGELFDELKKLCSTLGVTNRVHFVDFVDHATLPAYLQAADIFIRPSLSEGMGNSFIEAMAAGVPVIATNVGGIPDFIADRQTGYFCEVRNPKSIANTVTHILANQEEVSTVVENAQRLVKEKYTWDIVAPQMDMAFRETYGK